jgi:hypothetical protein
VFSDLAVIAWMPAQAWLRHRPFAIFYISMAGTLYAAGHFTIEILREYQTTRCLIRSTHRPLSDIL